MFKYLLLPSIAFAFKTPFIGFSNFLNNSNFNNKESQNDHVDQLLIDYHYDPHCYEFYATEQLDLETCFCELENCFSISSCGGGYFYVDIYHYSIGVTDECDSNYHQEQYEIPTPRKLRSGSQCNRPWHQQLWRSNGA